MKDSLKKRGQKFLRRFSRASQKAGENGKEHIKANFLERFSHIKDIRLLVLEWILLVSALILIAITQAFWFKDSYSEQSFSRGGTYTEATLGKVNSLNPLFATTSSEKTLSRLMFATISEIDYSGHPGLGLANSITSDDSGKVWTVKLRDGLKWSDSEPLTNEDVIFTINLIKNSNVSSIYDSNLTGVKVSENEDGEIVFTLPAAYADFISALNIPVVPKHILENADPKTLIEDAFSTAPITSGPFTFNATQTISAEGEKVVYLSSNPYYYKGATLLSGFAVHAFIDKANIISALNSGSITATAELTHTDSSQIISRQIYEKNASLSSGAFAFFNTSRPYIKNRSIRNAIRQGINVSEIRDIASDTTPLDYPLASSQISLTNYPTLPNYDANIARDELTDLLEGETPTFNIATVNYSYLPIVANSIAEQIRALGLTAEISVYEENQEFITNIISNRNYDILIYEIELGADPDLLPYYHSSQATSAGLNLSNYKNSMVDDLLLGARATLDDELRIAKYESFLDYWIDDVPAIGLYQSNLNYYYNKNTRALSEDTHLVTPLDRFSNITTWSVVKNTLNLTP